MIGTGRRSHADVINELAREETEMQSNFAQALAFTLEFEGGYCDNPHDSGGPTCHGITLATFSRELGRPASASELRNISPATVASIYRKKFWTVANCDAMPAGVDLMLFDVAANNGPGRAIQWKSQTNGLRPADRIERLDELRLGFWKRLAIWVYFGRGWARREIACKALALKLAGA
jgi:lysozyme family protein